MVMSNGHVALVIVANAHETLIKWVDDGTVEDADNYTIGLEVISESRYIWLETKILLTALSVG